ncbi:hypothetical protein [Polyangium aurulentum]|uniref:hypothetical protein n=1 Tax=Polyangium aurulentum TaxID=2567896 RepID=UPI0010ADBF6C|nr:hypothetical protein [Polyangium aurulentum]UQA62299.1 hypothetical protein E8A73_018255 [Polyangium aurulentum]
MALRSATPWLTLGLSLALSACGGAPKQVGSEDNWEKPPPKTEDTASSDTGSSDTGEAAAPESSGDPGFNEEQTKQIEIALRRGQTKASNCSTVVPDAPSGEGEVELTLDGKIGKITEASVGAPFAGSPVETCIKRSFIGEYILPFEGDQKVIKYKVKLAAKAPETPAKKK